MNASSFLGLLVLILVVGGVAAVFVLVILNARRKQKAREVFLAGLGFARVPVSPKFFERVDLIYRRTPNQRFRMDALFEKQTPQGSFFVFDLVETSGEDNTWLANGSVAVVSPDLRLPHLHISGRPQLGGKVGTWMAGAAEKVIDWAASRAGMSRVDLSEYIELDERLMAIATDASIAQEFLDRERLGRLLWIAEMDHLSEVDCNGDCFVLKRSVSQTRGGDMETAQRALLDDARRVYTALA
jgi:hypothetical protein